MDKNDSSLIMHHVMMIAFFKCVVCNIRAINEETSNVLKEEMILRPYSTIDGKAVCEQCRLADSDRNRECNLGNIHRIILQYFCMFYLSGKYIKNSSMAQISKIKALLDRDKGLLMSLHQLHIRITPADIDASG